MFDVLLCNDGIFLLGFVDPCLLWDLTGDLLLLLYLLLLGNSFLKFVSAVDLGLYILLEGGGIVVPLCLLNPCLLWDPTGETLLFPRVSGTC